MLRSVVLCSIVLLMKPSETFARRVREVRRRKPWRQQDLSDRLREFDWVIDQSVIARIENPKKRPVSLDEAIVISAALGTTPIHLIVDPTDVEPLHLAPNHAVNAREARQWLRGQRPLREEDALTYYSEVSVEERKRQYDTTVSLLIHLAHSVIDAVEKSADRLDPDAREVIADRIDLLNRELDRQQGRNHEQ